MENKETTYDKKLIITSVIIVVIIAAAFFFYWDLTKVVIRVILEAKFTYFLLWTITVLIFLLHYFRLKDKELRSEPIVTKKFGVFGDNALGGITYATTITTSLTLLKGLYIQKFFDDKKYFTEFNDLDLMTVFGVTTFLLYLSLMKVIDIGKETYKVQKTQQVLNEAKEVVVQKSEEEILMNLNLGNQNQAAGNKR